MLRLAKNRHTFSYDKACWFSLHGIGRYKSRQCLGCIGHCFSVISFFDFYGHIAYGHSRLPQLSLQGFGRSIFNSLLLHEKQAIYPENFLNGSLISAMVSPSHSPPASIQNTYTSIRIIFRGPAGIRHLCAQTNT